ncbi:MAG: gluconolactonase [bacterium]|jgi:gluconolactonase
MNTIPTFEIIDPRFSSLILGNVSLRRIATGFLWTEGPAWIYDQQVLLFSDIPNEKVYRWTLCGTVTTFRCPSNYANGRTLDLQGRIITCEHGTRAVTRIEHDGATRILCDSYNGRQLNSPNDVVVKSDGTIWFTDPSYGILSDYEGYKAEPVQDGNYVYRFDPVLMELLPVATDFVQPNGLAFSVDESQLYIAESGSSHDASVPSVIRVLDVADNKLSNCRDFATINPGLPDGLRVDALGNIWTSAADGVHCYDSYGMLLGKIRVPEVVSNLTFGGPRGNQLFITATTSVYAVYVNTSAAKRP